MGNIVSVLNIMCKKMEELNTLVNHNTDGIEFRLEIAQAQLDDNSSKLSQMDIDMEKVRADSLEAQQVVKNTSQALEEAKEVLETNKLRLDAMEIEVNDLQEENEVVKGLLFRHSNKFQSLNKKVTNLTARSMRNNITISGLAADMKGENCKNMVVKFFQDQMHLPIEPKEIFVAHSRGGSRIW